MRKIGIVTYWQAVNTGAFLQKYALQKVINASCGVNAEIIRHRSGFGAREIVARLRGNRGLRRVTSLKEPYAFWWKTRKYCDYSRRVLPPTDPEWSTYDTVLFGSDEIWNTSSWFAGYSPVYFGGNFTGPRKISYAPSFGDVNDLADLHSEVGGMLGQFRAISVRDANSQKLVEELTGWKAPIVLDPTLLYDFDKELRAYQPIQNKYLAVYATHVDEYEKQELESYARRAGLKLIACGFPQQWIEHNAFPNDPFGALSVIRSANAVFTNTFHGAVFSLKYGRPFALGDISGKKRKIESLVEELGVAEVLHGEKIDIESRISVAPSQIIEQRIQTRKKDSIAWLCSAIDSSEAP